MFSRTYLATIWKASPKLRRATRVLALVALALTVIFGSLSYLRASCLAQGRLEGQATERKIWQEKYAKDMRAKNERVAEIERLATEQTKALHSELIVANAQLKVLQDKVRESSKVNDSVVFNKDGRKLICRPETVLPPGYPFKVMPDEQPKETPATPVAEDVYLGPDFSDAWNKMNEVLK